MTINYGFPAESFCSWSSLQQSLVLRLRCSGDIFFATAWIRALVQTLERFSEPWWPRSKYLREIPGGRYYVHATNFLSVNVNLLTFFRMILLYSDILYCAAAALDGSGNQALTTMFVISWLFLGKVSIQFLFLSLHWPKQAWQIILYDLFVVIIIAYFKVWTKYSRC